MRAVGGVLRRLVSSSSSSSITENLVLSSTIAASCSTLILSQASATHPLPLSLPFSFNQVSPAGFSSFFPHHYRTFSSSSSSADPSNVVLIESEEQFNDSLRKVQDESSPAIFYFTAVWCGPCRLLSPIIVQLCEKYPHVTTYKIDIDKEGLANALSKLDVHSVPTLHFFQNGKKAGEVIGADVDRLKDTMEALYK